MSKHKKKAAGLIPELQMIIEKNAAELSLVHGNLLSATGGKDVKSLFITSCHAQEGKSVAAVGMAFAIAKHAGLNVLLVDGNLMAPALHQMFAAPVSMGLTDVIYNAVPVGRCIQKSGLENVSLLTRGSEENRSNTSSAALYRSPEFVSILKQLEGKFDLIIFDGPPLLVSSEAAWACPHFDGVLLVIACEDTKWEIAEHVLDRIKSVGGTMVGAILNRRKYYVPSNLYEKY